MMYNMHNQSKEKSSLQRSACTVPYRTVFIPYTLVAIVTSQRGLLHSVLVAYYQKKKAFVARKYSFFVISENKQLITN